MSRRAKLILINSTLMVVLLTLLMAIAAGLDFTDRAEAEDRDTQVSASQARELSLTAAGVDSGEATVIRRKLYSYGNNKNAYDVRFYTNDGHDMVNYEYSVDADSGEILHSNKTFRRSAESIYAAGVQAAKKAENSSKEDESTNYIGVKKAIRVVLKDAGLSESEVDISGVELKHKNGNSFYKVEFDSEEIEYEFHVDAVSGKVLLREVEYPEDEDD